MRWAGVLVLGLSGCAGVDCCQPMQPMVQPVTIVPMRSAPVVVGRPQSDCVDDVVSTPVESGPPKAASDLSPSPSAGSPFGGAKTPALEPIPKG